jgi:hypothetical protein
MPSNRKSKIKNRKSPCPLWFTPRQPHISYLSNTLITIKTFIKTAQLPNPQILPKVRKSGFCAPNNGFSAPKDGFLAPKSGQKRLPQTQKPRNPRKNSQKSDFPPIPRPSKNTLKIFVTPYPPDISNFATTSARSIVLLPHTR